jgi:hypothetical protein
VSEPINWREFEEVTLALLDERGEERPRHTHNPRVRKRATPQPIKRPVKARPWGWRELEESLAILTYLITLSMRYDANQYYPSQAHLNTLSTVEALRTPVSAPMT